MLTLPAAADPNLVEVVRDGAILRTGPSSDFDRYSPVVSGVRFHVLDRQGDWLHVAIPDAYIQAKDVREVPEGSPAATPQVQRVRVTETPEGKALVRIQLGSPCAWQIRSDPQAGRMWVDFPGTPMMMYEMAFAQDARRIPDARLQPSPQGTTLELVVADGQWGYQARFEKGDLLLTLAAPIVAHRHPLEGVRITLDAGHGGTDKGAPGLNGTLEKNHNLAVTLALKKELEDGGAIVTLTRSADPELTPEGSSADEELGARVAVGEQSDSQLFVSIHHNAMANIEASRLAHGVHVYYFQPASRALAQSVAGPLAEAIGESSFMHLWRSFFLTRQTGMPAILVECNFISNPHIEKEMLMDPDYPNHAARGIRRGLENYLRDTAIHR